jgi:hypothetical protein
MRSHSGAYFYTTSVNVVANFAVSMMHSVGVLSLTGNAIYSHCTNPAVRAFIPRGRHVFHAPIILIATAKRTPSFCLLQ